MIKLEGLAAFAAVAETGSIAGAARRLGVSTSVISERLNRLESDLGTALVQRTTRKLSLSEDGLAFLEHANELLRCVEEAAASVRERHGALSGPLRISAPVSFGVAYLGPALVEFAQNHPEIDLSLDLDDRFVDVAGDGFDAVIRIGQVADRRLIAHVLAPSRRLLVAAPSYLERHERPANIDDLRRHDAIHYSNRGSEDWRFVTPNGNQIVRAHARIRVNNGDLMRIAAEAGLGIALLPSFIVADSIATDRLIKLDIGASIENDQIHVLYAKGQGRSARLAALVKHLRNRFANPTPWDAQIFADIPI